MVYFLIAIFFVRIHVQLALTIFIFSALRWFFPMNLILVYAQGNAVHLMNSLESLHVLGRDTDSPQILFKLSSSLGMDSLCNQMRVFLKTVAQGMLSSGHLQPSGIQYTQKGKVDSEQDGSRSKSRVHPSSEILKNFKLTSVGLSFTLHVATIHHFT